MRVATVGAIVAALARISNRQDRSGSAQASSRFTLGKVKGKAWALSGCSEGRVGNLVWSGVSPIGLLANRPTIVSRNPPNEEVERRPDDAHEEDNKRPNNLLGLVCFIRDAVDQHPQPESKPED